MKVKILSPGKKVLPVIVALIAESLVCSLVWSGTSAGASQRPKAKGLDVAIVVDDAVGTSLGGQLRDLANFIRALPPRAQVEVVYAANGVARIEQSFTTEHEAAAKSLRLPSGSNAGASGLYDALRDLAKRWPHDGAKRVVILVSQGVDLVSSNEDSSPFSNALLDRAVGAFQREGITAYTIYASDAGRVGVHPLLVSNGQGCLSRLAAETGGEAYFQGRRTPIDFNAYLEQIRRRLGQ
jgi:intracellular sulfur oxidation DsrE/DsrF family protein